MFLRFEGQTHDSRHSVSTECEVYRIEEGEFMQPSLSARAKFFAKRAGKRTKPSILWTAHSWRQRTGQGYGSDVAAKTGRCDKAWNAAFAWTNENDAIVF
jgi:hypothetical protein